MSVHTDADDVRTEEASSRFKLSSMTFLEHVEELRRRVIISIVAALVASGICYALL